MQQLTPAGNQAVQSLAQRYGVSVDAVTTLLSAVSAGGGGMAQFYHPELGGGGQWMRGGMTMVGDMFNSRLQSTVSGLCAELSALLGQQQVFAAAPPSEAMGFMSSANSWWPSELGQPSSSGGQNDSRYANFPSARRLAVSRGGQVDIYDTLDHQIGGVQQQQGGPQGSLSFSSQFGTFTVDSLPLMGPAPAGWNAALPQSPPSSGAQPSSREYPPQATQSYSSAGTSASPQSSGDILSAIERLGQLHQQGVLSADEFRAKKAELLSRL